jgi:hypothetical protein
MRWGAGCISLPTNGIGSKSIVSDYVSFDNITS